MSFYVFTAPSRFVGNEADSAHVRNYRGVFGRARGERVLQFPSYSFDVSVMNIWDTFAVSCAVASEFRPRRNLLTLDFPARSRSLLDNAGFAILVACRDHHRP